MLKRFLQVVALAMAVWVVLEQPQAFAVLGIRAARTAMAARRAEKMREHANSQSQHVADPHGQVNETASENIPKA